MTIFLKQIREISNFVPVRLQNLLTNKGGWNIRQCCVRGRCYTLRLSLRIMLQDLNFILINCSQYMMLLSVAIWHRLIQYDNVPNNTANVVKHEKIGIRWAGSSTSTCLQSSPCIIWLPTFPSYGSIFTRMSINVDDIEKMIFYGL